MTSCSSKKCKKKCESSSYNALQQEELDRQNENLKIEVENLKKEIDKTNNDLTRLMHAQNEQMDLLMEIVQNCLNIVIKSDEQKNKR